MTPEEVNAEIEKLCHRDWETELAPLIERLRQTDSTVAFNALFTIASHSQDRGPAAPAALLLWRVNPKCPISCQEALMEMLDEWDISIEEVPFYLARQFGISTVRATTEELLTTIAAERQRINLETILYWLGCYQEMLDYRNKHST